MQKNFFKLISIITTTRMVEKHKKSYLHLNVYEVIIDNSVNRYTVVQDRYNLLDSIKY